MKPDTFLSATSLLDDDYFAKAIVFIAECNSDGASCFVINRPLGRNLNELAEFSNGIPFPLYEGGPVDHEHLYIIHRRPELVSGGKLIGDNIYLGGEMKDVIKYLNNGALIDQDIKIFSGYCGWDKDELDKEIEEGSWEVVEPVLLFGC